MCHNVDDYKEKYSARGPSANGGKYDRAVMIAITAKIMTPKVSVSVLRVPAPLGMYFLLPSKPAIANGPMMGRNRASNKEMPVVRFQNTLLSARPSNPLPLFAFAEVNSYSISEKP